MKWILMVFYNGPYGAASNSTEFNSEEACISASEILREKIGGRYTTIICMPKG